MDITDLPHLFSRLLARTRRVTGTTLPLLVLALTLSTGPVSADSQPSKQPPVQLAQSDGSEKNRLWNSFRASLGRDGP